MDQEAGGPAWTLQSFERCLLEARSGGRVSLSLAILAISVLVGRMAKGSMYGRGGPTIWDQTLTLLPLSDVM